MASTIGVSGGEAFASFNRAASRFFSSVLKKTFIVVRRDLFGLQSSAETGVCSQTGHEEGRVDWPGACIRTGRFNRLRFKLTRLADRLFAARKAKRVYSEPAADGASKLDGNLILGEGAVAWLAEASYHITGDRRTR